MAQTPSNPPADGSATTSAVIARLNERHLVSEEAQRIASVGIWRYDYVTERVTWSDEMYRIFGLSSESFQPTFENFLACVHPDDREAMVAADRESGTGKPMNFEHRIVRPDGEVRFVHEQAQVVVHDELGGHPLLLGTTQDITERKRAEETVAAQRAKLRDLQARMNGFARQQGLGTMAQNLAHEINQPLTAISNYAFSLRRLGPDSVIAAGLKEIERSALRAGDIMRRMRTMSQRGPLKRERIDLDELVRTAAEFSALACEGVSFNFNCHAGGGVVADHIQIAQVLTNLISNACEAMEHSDPKIITISTTEDADQVTICVSDRGPGLPPDLQLFEVTTSSKEGGMGIGLSICRTIVEAHEGRIRAENIADGARFCFSLPKADADEPKARQENAVSS